MINTTILRKYVTEHFQHVPDHDFKFNIVCRPAKQFAFSEITQCATRYCTNECGTVGCACGWLPLMFPQVTRNLEFDELMYQGTPWSYDVLAAHLLDLPHHITERLFTPNCQQELHKDLPTCTSFATVKQVSDMLIHFCDLADVGKIKLP